MSVVIRRRGRRRRSFTLGEYFRQIARGLIFLAIGLGLLGGVSAFASSAAQYMNFNVTIAGNTVQVPLGSAINVILGIGALLSVLYGMRLLIRVRL